MNIPTHPQPAPTPMTDAARKFWFCCDDEHGIDYVEPDFAEDLERLLAERDAEVARLKEQVEGLLPWGSGAAFVAQLRTSLSAAEERAGKAEAFVNSAAQIGDAVNECATRLLNMITKGDFTKFATMEATRINLGQLVECSHELRNPGSTKWGTPNAQAHWDSEHAKLCALESRLSAVAEEIAATGAVGALFGADIRLRRATAWAPDHRQEYLAAGIAKTDSAHSALTALLAKLRGEPDLHRNEKKE